MFNLNLLKWDFPLTILTNGSTTLFKHKFYCELVCHLRAHILTISNAHSRLIFESSNVMFNYKMGGGNDPRVWLRFKINSIKTCFENVRWCHFRMLNTIRFWDFIAFNSSSRSVLFFIKKTCRCVREKYLNRDCFNHAFE